MSERPSSFEPPRDFTPINDHAEEVVFFKEAAKLHSSAMIWTKDQTYVTHSRLILIKETEKLFFAQKPKDFSVEEFRSGLGPGDGCFFSISLSRANIFFKARFVGMDGESLKFAWPEKVFKVQRRKDARWTLSSEQKIKVEVSDPADGQKFLSKTILDISAGGLAFNVSEEEAPLFKSGALLPVVRFSVLNRKLSFSAEIRHLVKVPGGMKVGVHFKNMKADDNHFLAAFVFDESRKYFSRFL